MCKKLTTAFQKNFQTPQCNVFDGDDNLIQKTHHDIFVSCTEITSTNATFIVVAKQISQDIATNEITSIGAIVNQPITIFYDSIGGTSANDIDWWELFILILKKTFPSQPYP